jgi:large subunit ribosomal protein L19
MTYQILLNSKVVQNQLRSDIPDFKTGTVVDVHYKISEGNKERVQIFSGIVIDRHGGNSLDATFTVLKNATAGIKVTRTFPLHSPHIAKVELVSRLQRTKQASLYHLHEQKDPIKVARTKSVKSIAN